ncbi:hypothetical protein L6164_031527 [Bauhinia variegata]|uniref:Uncharacterized protein n=1 Tax=Bauhinia variegata TaxID=167791 RepID=A0ACB9LFP6_BAUVA|nr:hypothetical protein L6164_031527 [Bauhinia variegata]
MSPSKIPGLVLQSSSNHRSIPVIGLGTASDDPGSDATKLAVIEAIKQGYRHFDTAYVYGSEKALGEGIAEALRLGLVGSRDELFITSKLWCTDTHADCVLPALRTSLRNLQLEYLDLYLIHCPISAKHRKLFPDDGKVTEFDFLIKKDDVVPLDLQGVWRALEDAQNLGLTKSIGVSNFSRKKLENLLSFASIPPSVNQVELNPSWQQKSLREYCKSKGIIITAYSPLGAKGSSWGTNNVMDNQLLKEVAELHGKSVAQVSLRWLYEQGVSFVVKSYNKERLKQNLEIFDWSLTENDYEKISQVKQERNMNGPTEVPIEDLWDGET